MHFLQVRENVSNTKPADIECGNTTEKAAETTEADTDPVKEVTLIEGNACTVKGDVCTVKGDVLAAEADALSTEEDAKASHEDTHTNYKNPHTTEQNTLDTDKDAHATEQGSQEVAKKDVIGYQKQQPETRTLESQELLKSGDNNESIKKVLKLEITANPQINNAELDLNISQTTTIQDGV